ncbi:MAG: S8/S53 family peptidase [Jatrophihabitans sp.]
MTEQSREASRSTTPRRREPSLSPPDYVLTKHGGRVLDPSTAVRLPGQGAIRATVYVGARLLLRGADVSNGEVPAELQQAAAQAGLVATVYPPDRELAEIAKRSGVAELAARTLVARIELAPAGDGPASPPDAWQVLQNYRAILGVKSQKAADVSLDHLVTATGGPDIEGVPLWESHGVQGVPLWESHGVDSPSTSFGVPGQGGRGPVAWQGPHPLRRDRTDLPCRRPVVAILDTGVGKHPWLQWPVVWRHPRVGTLPIGLTDLSTDPEITGNVDDPLEGTLDPDAGHGTFIAGLIHQKCADAKIISVRVMHGDGAVAEGDVLEALNRLLLRHAAALHAGDKTGVVDVVSLSMGYYHELPADEAFDHLLLAPLRELGKLGVVVVASAGNDATNRHMYPAGFAPHPGTQLPAAHDAVPVVSVGARNPDDKTIALFSNQGDWVSCYRHGAAVVSTMPTTFNGSLQPSARVHIGGLTRQTLDMDDFSSGFGTWSGTSFAAPILAGELAAAMLDGGDLDPCNAAAAVDRGWVALHDVAQMDRP